MESRLSDDRGLTSRPAEGWALADEHWEHKRWEQASRLYASLAPEADTAGRRRLARQRAAIAFRRSQNFDGARQMLAQILDEDSQNAVARRELGRLEHAIRSSSRLSYWDKRIGLLYLHVVREIALRIAKNANSVADVGSYDTPNIEWFEDVPRRVSLDIARPYHGEGIESIHSDFLDWKPAERFDFGICLQVMEHLQDPRPFAQHLLEVFDTCLVSVPYMWPAEKTAGHPQDPVDEAKMRSWFGREANYSYRIKELNGWERLIQVYDTQAETPWSTVKEDEFRYRWSLRGADAVLEPRR